MAARDEVGKDGSRTDTIYCYVVGFTELKMVRMEGRRRSGNGEEEEVLTSPAQVKAKESRAAFVAL